MSNNLGIASLYSDSLLERSALERSRSVQRSHPNGRSGIGVPEMERQFKALSHCNSLAVFDLTVPKIGNSCEPTLKEHDEQCSLSTLRSTIANHCSS